MEKGIVDNIILNYNPFVYCATKWGERGYAVNQRRLEYLEKTIKLIDITNRIDERLEGNDTKEILKVIGDYSKD